MKTNTINYLRRVKFLIISSLFLVFFVGISIASGVGAIVNYNFYLLEQQTAQNSLLVDYLRNANTGLGFFVVFATASLTLHIVNIIISIRTLVQNNSVEQKPTNNTLLKTSLILVILLFNFIAAILLYVWFNQYKKTIFSNEKEENVTYVQAYVS